MRLARGIECQSGRPDSSFDEVSKKIPALVGGAEAASAIDLPAGDRLALGMAVFEDWFSQRSEGGWTACDVVVCAFPIAPAVVAPAAPPRLVVDLFPLVLSDVGDDESSCASTCDIVKGVPPRIPQTEAPNLGSCARRTGRKKRVVWRHSVAGRIRVGNVHVDSQHLAEKLGGSLGSMVGIVRRAAVAKADEQEAIGAKCQMTSIVICKGLSNECRSADAIPTQVETRDWICDKRI